MRFSGRFQPGMLIWRTRDRVRGIRRRIGGRRPAPSVAPRPTVTGATSWVSEPMNTSSSMTVLCFGAIVVAGDGAGADDPLADDPASPT